MILSAIALNPAIDKTYFVEHFSIDALNRATNMKTNIGGKGVNVAVTAARCGMTCFASGFLSGYNGQMVGKFLKDAGVTTDFVYTEGETRVNIKIIDTVNQTYTDLNEAGPAVPMDAQKDLYKKVEDLAIKSDMVYLGGSFHSSMGDDVYKKLVTIVKEKGAVAVLDADGAALQIGIEAKPNIIKPNLKEMESLAGHRLKTVSDAVNAVRKVQEKGVETVLLTMGGNGAVAATPNGIYRAYSINAPVRSTVGAGDSFLCGFLYGKSIAATDEETLQYAVSFATAKIQTEGTDIPLFEALVCDKDKVTVEHVE